MVNTESDHYCYHQNYYIKLLPIFLFTQMHIYDGVTFSGAKRTFCGDVVDTEGMTFKTGVSIRVLTGWYGISSVNPSQFEVL